MEDRGVKMLKPLDRITEAYYDKMGASFGDKVRSRIHWVCEQAKGEKILDVGCSQGITSILLGREGKQVLGLDLLQESIDFANEALSNEAEVTKKYVEFKVANFIDYDFENKKFDSIIFGEILEHITDPERFVKKAAQLLSDNGRIIVTVPFGINDYFDHKKTYYMQGLIDLQNDQMNITEIEVLGKWIGAVFVKGNDKPITFDNTLVTKLEDGFYNVERNLVDQLTNTKNRHNELKKKSNETEKKLKDKTNELSKLKATVEELNYNIEHLNNVNKNLKLSLSKTEEDYNDIKIELDKTENASKNKKIEIKELELSISDLTHRLQKSEKQNEQFQEEKLRLEQRIIDLNSEINNYNQNSQEELLKIDKRNIFLEKKIAEFRERDKEKQNQINELQSQLKNLQNQKQDEKLLRKLHQEILNEKKKKVKSDELLLEAYNKEERLLKTHSQLMKRYEALKSSKLGSLTISYWKWRRKRFGGKASGPKVN